jgi:hypothetical protein
VDCCGVVQEFYSAIPQNQQPAVDNSAVLEEKQELVQLLKDMLTVDEITGDTATAEVDMKYRALRCQINALAAEAEDYQQIKEQVLSTQIKGSKLEVKNVYTVRREVERQLFTKQMDNQVLPLLPLRRSFDGEANADPGFFSVAVDANVQRLLFHGSRISNWVGILSRGVLLPHIVTQSGGTRTDAGMLGAGIYFGDCSSTAAQYTTPGQQGTRMMLVCNVALGKVTLATRPAANLVMAHATTLRRVPTSRRSIQRSRSRPRATTACTACAQPRVSKQTLWTTSTWSTGRRSSTCRTWSSLPSRRTANRPRLASRCPATSQWSCRRASSCLPRSLTWSLHPATNHSPPKRRTRATSRPA